MLDRTPGEQERRGRRLADDPEWARAEYRMLTTAIAAGDAGTAATVARRHAQWLFAEDTGRDLPAEVAQPA